MVEQINQSKPKKRKLALFKLFHGLVFDTICKGSTFVQNVNFYQPTKRDTQSSECYGADKCECYSAWFRTIILFLASPQLPAQRLSVTSVQQHPHNSFLLLKVFTLYRHRLMKYLQHLQLSNCSLLKVIGTRL